AHLVRRAHLPEDLALSGHHRIEAGRDAEQMKSRSLVLQPVERGTEVCFEGEQCRFAAPFGVGGRLVGEIELRPIARREAHGFPGGTAQAARQISRLLARQLRTLAELDRRTVMRDADEDDSHEKCVTGNASRTTATSRNPASNRYAARRPRRPAPRRSTAYAP